MSGLVSYRAGLSAEDAVAARYAAQGGRVIARRWRGGGGEIDLILDQAGCIVFVEVKQAGDFDRAAARISPAQRARLFAAAEVFIGSLPGAASRDCRFDVALVDGAGRTRIVENAFL